MSDHVPVLLEEVLEALNPKPGESMIDVTLGGGGHALEIIKRLGQQGKFLGLDWDKSAIEKFEGVLESSEIAKPEIKLVHKNFRFISRTLEEKSMGLADGLLLDLGFSSDQLEGKGFSFQRDEPLIMRYDGDASKRTAARVVNELDERTLAEIFKKFGEEKKSRAIAKSIAKQRREKSIRTTGDLVKAIKRVKSSGKRGLHPATKVFMALRIFINEELENLRDVLENLTDIVKTDGRVVIISFHSLEDRMVKHNFRDLVKENKAEWIKKLARPTKEEIERNPRSRSAKLRAIRLINNQ